MAVSHVKVGDHPAGSSRIAPSLAGRKGARLLDSLHIAKMTIQLEPFETVFAQGDRGTEVMYIEKGRVRLSVRSPGGHTSLVAMLHSGAFLG